MRWLASLNQLDMYGELIVAWACWMSCCRVKTIGWCTAFHVESINSPVLGVFSLFFLGIRGWPLQFLIYDALKGFGRELSNFGEAGNTTMMSISMMEVRYRCNKLWWYEFYTICTSARFFLSTFLGQVINSFIDGMMALVATAQRSKKMAHYKSEHRVGKHLEWGI